MRRRELIAGAAGTLLFSFLPADFARGAQMVAVRMWPAQEYTRVTLEHDAPLKFKYFFVRSSRPLRLVVDIEGLDFTAALKQQIEAVKADDPYIQAMRIGQYQPGIVRLVMDLKTDVKPEVFQLKPFANYKYRLVFDLYPAVPVDPISKILAGVAEGEDDTDVEDDPLAALLADLENGKKPEPAKDPEPSKPVKKPPVTTAKDDKKPTKQPPKQPAKKKHRLVIVVDPGHGGEDPGAIGRNKTREKDVVLSIGKLLAAEINKEPDMRAILTRSSDHFVSLGGRVAIARKARAHLLISIHADAWVKSSARGSSVFALSQRGATSASARWLAQRQNESDLIGGVNIANVDKTVASVLIDMTSSWTISYSLGLGAAVLREMKKINRLHKEKVEQAGFAVLKGQGIPSILVETAFISNPQEERLLKNRAHQRKIARAILTGIKKQLAANPSVLTSHDEHSSFLPRSASQRRRRPRRRASRARRLSSGGAPRAPLSLLRRPGRARPRTKSLEGRPRRSQLPRVDRRDARRHRRLLRRRRHGFGRPRLVRFASRGLSEGGAFGRRLRPLDPPGFRNRERAFDVPRRDPRAPRRKAFRRLHF